MKAMAAKGSCCPRRGFSNVNAIASSRVAIQDPKKLSSLKNPLKPIYPTPLMAASSNGSSGKRYAIVTGANRGIGFEICRGLASHGINVVLTARDKKRGLEALEKLKGSGFSDNVFFHQLDVANSSSTASLAEFVRSQFGRLDILVNNAGVAGAIVDFDAVRAKLPDIIAAEVAGVPADWTSVTTETYKLAVECLQTNYYGAKRMIEAFVPLLDMSQSPRIVTVSAAMGKLKKIPSEWAKGILNDIDSLTEERVDEVINEFLKDFKEGSLKAKGWPLHFSAYAVSKAAANAYSRTVAKKYPNFKVNCVCPGSVQTDMTNGIGLSTAEEGAAAPVRLALRSDDGPSGEFFICNVLSSFE